MKRSSKIVLVSVVSLGLVGVVAARQFDGMGCGVPGGWMSKKIAWELDLNDQQRTELDEFRWKMVDSIKDMRDQRPDAGEIQAVLGEQFNSDKAMSMLEQRLQRVQGRAPEMIAAFGEFYDSLDADQKVKLAEAVEKRVVHGGWRHRGPADKRWEEQ